MVLTIPTPTTIQTDVTTIQTDVTNIINKSQPEIEFPSAEAQDNISATGSQTTTGKTITVTLPAGVVIKSASLIALITALNNSANAQTIGLTVQGKKGAGAPTTFFNQASVIGFGATQDATTSMTTVQDVTAIVNAAATYTFNFLVNQLSANSVIYTTQYVLVITYGFV